MFKHKLVYIDRSAMALSSGTWSAIAAVLLVRGMFAAFPSSGRVDAGDMLMMDRFRQCQATYAQPVVPERGGAAAALRGVPRQR